MFDLVIRDALVVDGTGRPARDAAQITWDMGLRPSPALGVSRVVIGNCGFTIAPCRPEHRDITMRRLTHVWANRVQVADADGAMAPERPPGRLLRRFAM
jgi:N-acyl-D-aspartate/D-glutamate deacylase